MEGVGVYGGKDLRKRYLLSLEWNRVAVTDNDSGDDGTDEDDRYTHATTVGVSKYWVVIAQSKLLCFMYHPVDANIYAISAF